MLHFFFAPTFQALHNLAAAVIASGAAMNLYLQLRSFKSRDAITEDAALYFEQLLVDSKKFVKRVTGQSSASIVDLEDPDSSDSLI